MMARYVNITSPNGPKGWHYVDLTKDGEPVMINVVYTKAYNYVLLNAHNDDWYMEPECSATGESVRAVRESVIAHPEYYEPTQVLEVQALINK